MDFFIIQNHLEFVEFLKNTAISTVMAHFSYFFLDNFDQLLLRFSCCCRAFEKFENYGFWNFLLDFFSRTAVVREKSVKVQLWNIE